jgi:hypothetical protein
MSKALKASLGHADDSKCFSNSTVAEENKKKFLLENPQKKNICKVKVDDCLITSQTVNKCDYMFEITDDPNRYIFVELKGADVIKAVTQIVSTYEALKQPLALNPQNSSGVIVSSAVPGSDFKFRQLAQRQKITIKRRTNFHSEQA